MSPDLQKVLRRACARFNTGIRKPFEINGETLALEPAGYPMDEECEAWCVAELVVHGGRVNALDGSRSTLRIPLEEVSAEAVWTAYLQSQVDAVHAL